MLRKLVSRAGKLVPFIGWLSLKARYPRLRCGLSVDIVAARPLRIEGDVKVGARTRIFLQDQATLSVGASAIIGQDVHIQGDRAVIRIGTYTGVQDGCRLYGDVRIGDYCFLAPNVYLSAGSHVFAEEPFRPIIDQERRHHLPGSPIVVEDDCWLGINVVVLPGVTVGKGSVIGANAVVTRDVPPYSVMGGIPAKPIRARLDFSPPTAVDAGRSEDWPYFYQGFDVLNPHPEQGLPCREGFTLALALQAGQALSLDLFAAEAGMLRAGGQAVALLAGRNRVTVSGLPADRQAFSVDVRTWLRAAEVVEADPS